MRPVQAAHLLRVMPGRYLAAISGSGERAPPEASWRSSVFCWDTIPLSCLASARCAATSVPARKARPDVGHYPAGQDARRRGLSDDIRLLCVVLPRCHEEQALLRDW